MLSWIHLSDWHQRGASFDRKVVRDALIQDISNRASISEDLVQLDFAIFSGDLAFSGKSNEYELARKEFLEPVLKACGLGADRLLIVPGNHDLDRLLTGRANINLLTFSELDSLGTLFAEKHQRAQIEAPLGPYLDFAGSLCNVGRTEAFARTCIFKLDKRTIAFLCLNTAWLCGRNKDSKGEVDDYGELLIGEPQIEELLTGLQKCDLVVGILHHPFQWLALKNGLDDRVKARSRLMGACDIILHGHEHEPATFAMQGTYGSCLTIPAGATYDKRDAASQMYANGYNYCSIDLAQRKCKVHFRRFDGNRRWLPDVQTVGRATGSLELQIPEDPNKEFHIPRLPETSYLASVRPRELFREPHLIESGDPKSIGDLDSSILQFKKGGFETFIFLHDFGEGIRRLVNNRHIFAHAVSTSSPYKNVFSFHRGPEEFVEGKIDKPTWQVWLMSDSSTGMALRYPDTEKITPGWHYFLVRWDHDKPILELLIDGKVVESAENYVKYWPSRFLVSITVGCWPNPWKEHYVDTWLAGVGAVSSPFDREHIEKRLKRCELLQKPQTK